MKRYVYIINYELQSILGGCPQHPIGVYGSFEAAKKKTDKLFESGYNRLKINAEKSHSEPILYRCDDSRQEWEQDKLNGEDEGCCYSREARTISEMAAAIYGNEIAEDLQISIFKTEFHPE